MGYDISELLNEAIPKLKEIAARTNEYKPVLHPDGTMQAPTDGMKAAKEEVKAFARKFLEKNAASLKNDLTNYRIKNGPVPYNELKLVLNSIDSDWIKSGNNIYLKTGVKNDDNSFVDTNTVQVPINSEKIINKAIVFIKHMNSLHLKSFSCPPEFFYDKDYFDGAKLENLLQKDRYDGSTESKFTKIKSSDNLHKVGVKFNLEKNGVIFQYLALGLKGDEGKSKYHLVGRAGYNGGLKNIYHLEFFDAVRKTNDSNLDKDIETWAADGMMGAELFQYLSGSDTVEYKTDMKTKEFFAFTRFRNGDIVRKGDFNIKNKIPHYELLKEKPWVIGGPFFQYVVDFIDKNSKELKGLHKKLK